MKTIIAGSRTDTPELTLQHTLMAINDCPWVITSVVSGCAEGPDTFGAEWATNAGLFVHNYPANWKKYGVRAGHLRNAVMADNAEALIAVWDGVSKGTKNMIAEAKKRGLLIHIHLYSSDGKYMFE